MKKMAALIMAVSFILQMLTPVSAVQEIEEAAAYNKDIIVKGDAGAKFAGAALSVLLLKAAVQDLDSVSADDILYLNQIETDEHGKYALRAKMRSAEDAVLYVNYNGTNLSQTVDEAKIVTEIADFSLAVNVHGGKAAATANLRDKFGETSYGQYDIRLVLAFYDAAGKMMGVKLSERDYATICAAGDILTVEETLPEGAAAAKCLVWQTAESMIPLYGAKEYNLRRSIACIGDSLTAGAGASSTGKTYPGVLQTLIGEKQAVHNYGVGGETATTIAARQGGLDWQTEAFTIPAGCTGVPVSFKPIQGHAVEPFRQGGEQSAAINPCYINGVEGRLTWDGANYRFTRTEPGGAVPVPAGTRIITGLSKLSAEDILVINIGTNGGYGASNYDVDALVDIHKKMIANCAYDNPQYVVVVYSVNLRNYVRDDIKKALGDAFGEHALLLDDYFRSEQALTDAGLTPTDADREAVQKGEIPQSLLSDGLHWNDYGYKILGTKVYEKLVELGYVF